MPSNKGKGKEVATDWSNWEWNDKGYWVSSRRKSSGEEDYEYRYSEPVQHQHTPRFRGPDITGINDPQSPNYQPQTPDTVSGSGSGSSPYTSYTSNTSPSYTTTPRRGSIAGTPYPANTSCYGSSPPMYPSASTPVSTSAITISPPLNTSSGLTTYTPDTRPEYAPPTQEYVALVPASVDEITQGLHRAAVTSIFTIHEQSTVASTPEQDRSKKALGGAIAENNPASNAQVTWPIKTIKTIPRISDNEKLDGRYRVVEVKHQKRFWKQGRVFMMLWTEPAGDNVQVPAGGGTRAGSHFSTTWLNGTAYSEIRRFVVVGEGHGNTICSPIHTYSGQATLKHNLAEPQQHAMIYTSQQPPQEVWYEAKDGTIVRENLSKLPIKVNSELNDPEGQLDTRSRINYCKIYTVEKNVRVLNIGMVDPNYIHILNANCFVRPRTELPERPRKDLPPRVVRKRDDSSKSGHQESSKRSERGSSRRGDQGQSGYKDDTRRSEYVESSGRIESGKSEYHNDSRRKEIKEDSRSGYKEGSRTIHEEPSRRKRRH